MIVAAVIVQHKVKDFATWKHVFDSAVNMRKAGGELSADVYRDASDPNKLTVVNKWDSIENAQKFIHSPDLMAAMAAGGVEGMPVVTFLNEA
jgi:quinol monooxygenase YgiN